jgi:uncharacterized membrane protein YqgA involved in biofilm formation
MYATFVSLKIDFCVGAKEIINHVHKNMRKSRAIIKQKSVFQYITMTTRI